MVFNIIKRKEDPIYLDCYTYSHYAYNHAKINYAKNYIPDWWKGEPVTNEDGNPTIKNCPAFVSFYSKGIVIPSWGEVDITINSLNSDKDAYDWASSNEDFTIYSHHKDQWIRFADKSVSNLKFMSPWSFKTREAVDFVWSSPTWSNPDTFNSLTVLPAVIQFKTQQFTEINFVIQQKEKEQKINIPPLTPLAILHPMSDRKIKIRHHLVDVDKYVKISRPNAGMVFPKEVIGNKRLAKTERFWEKADKLNKCPFE